MTNTKKIVTTLAATAILVTGAMAKDAGGYIAAGYASTKIDSQSEAAPVVDFGAKFGHTYKQTVGFRIVFSGSNENWSDATGNIGEFYYTLGYEVLKDTTLSAKVGYAFEDIGKIRDTSVYATGITYGAVAKYALSESFDIVATYTHGSLSYESLDYTMDVADIGLSFTF